MLLFICFSRPELSGKVLSSSLLHLRFTSASRCIKTSWFVWQTQMSLNSQSSVSLPASYLVIYYSHLHFPSPHTHKPACTRRWTLTCDCSGRKSIRPWHFCFKWAISRNLIPVYFLSYLYLQVMTLRSDDVILFCCHAFIYYVKS